MQRRLRQAFTAIKEQSYVSYAKIATSPADLPLQDKDIRELLKVVFSSPTSSYKFLLGFTHWFANTNCWRVALKCLVLHHLIRSLSKTSEFGSELVWVRSNRLLLLYPFHFRDSSSLSSEDYTIFIRSYPQLLEEALRYYESETFWKTESIDCISIDTDKKDSRRTIEKKTKETHQLIELLPQARLQSLTDRVMECRPIGTASRSFLVQMAMKHTVRESFVFYSSCRRGFTVVLDHLMQMPYQNCVAALGIYKKASAQADQLSEFYDWCKFMGLCGSYEYPPVDRIPKFQVQALERFLSGMWQIAESDSSTESPPNSATTFSLQSSCSSVAVMEPLIQPDEVDDNATWQELLEASIEVHSHCYERYTENAAHPWGS
ncbi:hypothetical protein NMG60_11023729 [Bertholletia excelsa]